MRVTIRGHTLPGRLWCDPEGQPLEDVHVGVQEGRDPVGLVPGDVASACWDIEVRVEADDEGGLDFKGPAVHGKRGERFVYLTWGDVPSEGRFDMFRRAKLMLSHVDPALVRAAEAAGGPLVATVKLTDDRGGPRCARVGPPDLAWSIGA